MDAMKRLAADGREDITVFSLAKEAGISRATFYTHFSDLEDVATSLISPVLERLGEEDAADVQAEVPLAERGPRSILRLLDAFIDSADLVRVISRWKVSSAVESLIVSALAARFARLLAEVPDAADESCSDHDHAVFLAGGTFVTVSSWILAEPEIPAEEIRERTRALVALLLERSGLVSRT